MTVTDHLIPPCADRPGDDPIFALNAEAKQRQRAGEDVLNSTLGALALDDGKLAVMPSVFEAMRRIPPEAAAAYAPISGPPSFLSAIVEDIFEGGPLAEHAVVAATPGGTGACHHVIVNFLDVGQKLLTTSYFWGPYSILANHTRRGFDTFEMFREDGGIDTESMEVALRRHLDEQGRALLILNTPCHNPTGYSLTDDDWSRIVEVVSAASERGPVSLLLDQAYTKFAAPGPQRWLSHVEKLLGKATILFAWSASKAFTQYGSRIGACVAVADDPAQRAAIQNALGYSCRGTWSNCNHLGMLAVAQLLHDPELKKKSEEEREGLRQLLSERVDLFNKLASAKGLRYPRYEGGFFVTVFTPNTEVTTAKMKELGVFIVPIGGAVRVALCATPVADIPRLVDALAEGVRAAGG
jgi:aromatic-amino-acid transaminase